MVWVAILNGLVVDTIKVLAEEELPSTTAFIIPQH